MTLNTYLNFNGNCREAFDFYIKNLGAKMLMCMTYDEAPPQNSDPECGEMPASDKIMHARIQLPDGSYIMGSDCPPARFSEQAGFSLNLGFNNVKDAERGYAAMSAKGQIFMPLAETFWADRFAMFKDQFGIPWMINVEKEKP